MSADLVVEYLAPPEDFTPVEPGTKGILGAYRVVWPDSFTVIVPHISEPHTVSATPLDPADEEHRAVIIAAAERTRASVGA